ERLRNPDLGLTLERIAAEGRAGFYAGDTARELVRASRAHGGFHTEGDLARQRSHWGEPVSARYRGIAVYETPPPTQGLSVLQMLRLGLPFLLGPLAKPPPPPPRPAVPAHTILVPHQRRPLARSL